MGYGKPDQPILRHLEQEVDFQGGLKGRDQLSCGGEQAGRVSKQMWSAHWGEKTGA